MRPPVDEQRLAAARRWVQVSDEQLDEALDDLWQASQRQGRLGTGGRPQRCRGCNAYVTNPRAVHSCGWDGNNERWSE